MGINRVAPHYILQAKNDTNDNEVHAVVNVGKDEVVQP